MKKYLLILLVFAAFQISAQTTYTIQWNTSVGDNASLTVELGDTVEWDWNGGFHDVVSDAGSQQSFQSQQTSDSNFVFSVLFDELGTNDYRCTIHPGSMNGTITVVETLSTQDKFRLNLNSYPNPVQDELTITSLLKISKIEVFSMLGKKVLTTQAGSVNMTNIKMGGLQNGLYFVNVTSESGETSVLRVMKK